MTTAMNVAKYFLSLQDEEAGDTISNMKLQKLLYYAQAYHLVEFREPLFEDSIEAWTHGPVVPAVYHDFKRYGPGAIPLADDAVELDERTTAYLNEIYRTYGQFSAWKLSKMTHEESPWREAWETDKRITNERLLDFFDADVVEDSN